jgi:hypothetical protein
VGFYKGICFAGIIKTSIINRRGVGFYKEIYFAGIIKISIIFGFYRGN